MAVTANQRIQAMDPRELRWGPVDAGRVLYHATIAFWERTSGSSEGYLTDLDDNGVNNFAGIVFSDKVDNSEGDAGDHDAQIYTSGGFVLEGADFQQAHVGDNAYATDNYTVVRSSSNATWIGKIIEYISATRVRVELFACGRSSTAADPT